MEHKSIIYSVTSLSMVEDTEGNIKSTKDLAYGTVTIRPGNDQVEITNRMGESVIVDSNAIECLSLALDKALRLIRLTNFNV